MIAGATYVELDGYLVALGEPLSGIIEFRPTAPFTLADGSARVQPKPLYVTLGGDGYFYVQLLATDTPTLEGIEWVWEMTTRTGTIKTEYLDLPSTKPVVHYAEFHQEDV